MSDFIKTVTGKTVLFIGCIVSGILLVLSIIGACFCLSHEVYTRSKSELFSDMIYEHLDFEARTLIFNSIDNFQVSNSKPNLIYEVKDKTGKLIINEGDFNCELQYDYTYSYKALSDGENITDVYRTYRATDADYIIKFGFKKGLPEKDVYGVTYRFTGFMYSIRFVIYFFGMVTFLAMVGCFIALMCASARRADDYELYPGPLNKLPFDIMMALVIITGIAFIKFCYNSYYETYTLIFAGVIYSNVVLGLCMSVAARIKQKTLIKNTVIFRILNGVWKAVCAVFKFIRELPIIWKTVLGTFIISGIEFYIMVCNLYEPDNLAILWIFYKLITLPIIFYLVIGLKRLAKAGDEIASGNIQYKIDARHMFFDIKKHAENLNNISKSIKLAVNKQLKSERMKTELITNVSHDIKTPLTSVINYSTLIANEECENPKIKEYAEVLTRQSERLKRLTDDLVEASKASTGNIEVELSPCDAAVFISQAAGEYQQKLDKAELTLITKLPNEPVTVMADGRRMWRVFDNLMNNICKYSMPNTRVYLTLEKTDGNAVIAFKNLSRESLDISEDELMERFVRGDSSRNTEGNGLGLAIAKSLCELQGGRLEIDIDGDLFKATITLPLK